jgi:tetratricopeptide (TPR) repeat protein
MKASPETQNEQYSLTCEQGGTTMIRQCFATMNEVLDELILHYSQASNDQKSDFRQQWDMLKSLSDDIIELWLQFEDKMGHFRDLQQASAAAPEPCMSHDAFSKGHGYFRLQMFDQASAHLEEVLAAYPDFLCGRLFLAMSLMHLSRWGEAQRHFQLIAAMADESRVQAIAFNALGCIQAVYAHLDKAQAYFAKALDADPGFGDARHNLESVCQGHEQIQLHFGSAELNALVQA